VAYFRHLKWLASRFGTAVCFESSATPPFENNNIPALNSFKSVLTRHIFHPDLGCLVPGGGGKCPCVGTDRDAELIREDGEDLDLYFPRNETPHLIPQYPGLESLAFLKEDAVWSTDCLQVSTYHHPHSLRNWILNVIL
jgi:hypothetical protein